MRGSLVLDLCVAGLVLVLSLALSLAPHAANVERAGDTTYLGMSMYPPDQAVYLSWIEQARQGNLTLGNLFDAHPSPARLPNITFLGIGRAARLAGTDTRTAYIAARAVALVLMLIAALALAGQMLATPAARRLALAWTMLGTGWGFTFVLLHGRGGGDDLFDQLASRPWCPADLGLPEFTPAVAGANYSHMVFGMALMALAFAGLARARVQGSVGWAFCGGVAALLCGYAHIYNDLVAAAVVTVLAGRAWWRGDRPRLVTAVAFLVPAVVPVAHYAGIVLTDPYMREWSRVPLPSPSPSMYAMGLGTAFVLAALAMKRMREEAATADDELAVTWLAVQSLLLYSGPFLSFERRMCEGLWFPFVLLAAAEAARRLRPLAGPRLLAALALIAATVLPTGLLVARMTGQRQPAHRWYFRPPAELSAIAELARLTAPSDCILAEPSVALLIPGLAGRKVPVGHVDHTRDYRVMVQAAIRFHTGQMPATEARAFVLECGATHYFASSMDRVPVPLGPDLLEPVWQWKTFGLYRIRRPPGAP